MQVPEEADCNLSFGHGFRGRPCFISFPKYVDCRLVVTDATIQRAAYCNVKGRAFLDDNPVTQWVSVNQAE